MVWDQVTVCAFYLRTSLANNYQMQHLLSSNYGKRMQFGRALVNQKLPRVKCCAKL